MASPTIEKHFDCAGVYRICWTKDGQSDHADKPVATADELEAVTDRWVKMGYRINSINRLAPADPKKPG